MPRRKWSMFLVCLLLVSCASEHSTPTAPAPVAADPAPPNTSPQGAVRRLVWSWNHRDMPTYAGLLTDDFQFVFDRGDSTGQPWRETPWGLGDEWRSSLHLMIGGGVHPPASDVRWEIDPNLVSLADPRAGRDPRWHRMVLTNVDLRVDCPDALGDTLGYPVFGQAGFFLVRADSAALRGWPAGALSDTSHWYVQRWEDFTLPPYGARRLWRTPMPGVACGWIKGRFWD